MKRAQTFRAVNYSVYTTIVDTCYYTTSVKTHRMYTTKSKQDCKLCTLGDDDVSMYAHRL